jgi:hypothetical protein
MGKAMARLFPSGYTSRNIKSAEACGTTLILSTNATARSPINAATLPTPVAEEMDRRMQHEKTT